MASYAIDFTKPSLQAPDVHKQGDAASPLPIVVVQFKDPNNPFKNLAEPVDRTAANILSDVVSSGLLETFQSESAPQSSGIEVQHNSQHFKPFTGDVAALAAEGFEIKKSEGDNPQWGVYYKAHSVGDVFKSVLAKFETDHTKDLSLPVVVCREAVLKAENFLKQGDMLHDEGELRSDKRSSGLTAARAFESMNVYECTISGDVTESNEVQLNPDVAAAVAAGEASVSLTLGDQALLNDTAVPAELVVLYDAAKAALEGVADVASVARVGVQVESAEEADKLYDSFDLAFEAGDMPQSLTPASVTVNAVQASQSVLVKGPIAHQPSEVLPNTIKIDASGIMGQAGTLGSAPIAEYYVFNLATMKYGATNIWQNTSYATVATLQTKKDGDTRGAKFQFQRGDAETFTDYATESYNNLITARWPDGSTPNVKWFRTVALVNDMADSITHSGDTTSVSGDRYIYYYPSTPVSSFTISNMNYPTHYPGSSGDLTVTVNGHTYAINETKDASFNDSANRQFNTRAAFFEALKADLTPAGDGVLVPHPSNPYAFYLRANGDLPVPTSSSAGVTITKDGATNPKRQFVLEDNNLFSSPRVERASFTLTFLNTNTNLSQTSKGFTINGVDCSFTPPNATTNPGECAPLLRASIAAKISSDPLLAGFEVTGFEVAGTDLDVKVTGPSDGTNFTYTVSNAVSVISNAVSTVGTDASDTSLANHGNQTFMGQSGNTTVGGIFYNEGEITVTLTGVLTGPVELTYAASTVDIPFNRTALYANIVQALEEDGTVEYVSNATVWEGALHGIRAGSDNNKLAALSYGLLFKLTGDTVPTITVTGTTGVALTIREGGQLPFHKCVVTLGDDLHLGDNKYVEVRSLSTGGEVVNLYQGPSVDNEYGQRSVKDDTNPYTYQGTNPDPFWAINYKTADGMGHNDGDGPDLDDAAARDKLKAGLKELFEFYGITSTWAGNELTLSKYGMFPIPVFHTRTTPGAPESAAPGITATGNTEPRSEMASAFTITKDGMEEEFRLVYGIPSTSASTTIALFGDETEDENRQNIADGLAAHYGVVSGTRAFTLQGNVVGGSLSVELNDAAQTVLTLGESIEGVYTNHVYTFVDDTHGFKADDTIQVGDSANESVVSVDGAAVTVVLGGVARALVLGTTPVIANSAKTFEIQTIVGDAAGVDKTFEAAVDMTPGEFAALLRPYLDDLPDFIGGGSGSTVSVAAQTPGKVTVKVLQGFGAYEADEELETIRDLLSASKPLKLTLADDSPPLKIFDVLAGSLGVDPYVFTKDSIVRFISGNDAWVATTVANPAKTLEAGAIEVANRFVATMDGASGTVLPEITSTPAGLVSFFVKTPYVYGNNSTFKNVLQNYWTSTGLAEGPVEQVDSDDRVIATGRVGSDNRIYDVTGRFHATVGSFSLKQLDAIVAGPPTLLLNELRSTAKNADKHLSLLNGDQNLGMYQVGSYYVEKSDTKHVTMTVAAITEGDDVSNFKFNDATAAYNLILEAGSLTVETTGIDPDALLQKANIVVQSFSKLREDGETVTASIINNTVQLVLDVGAVTRLEYGYAADSTRLLPIEVQKDRAATEEYTLHASLDNATFVPAVGAGAVLALKGNDNTTTVLNLTLSKHSTGKINASYAFADVSKLDDDFSQTIYVQARPLASAEVTDPASLGVTQAFVLTKFEQHTQINFKPSGEEYFAGRNFRSLESVSAVEVSRFQANVNDLSESQKDSKLYAREIAANKVHRIPGLTWAHVATAGSEGYQTEITTKEPTPILETLTIDLGNYFDAANQGRASLTFSMESASFSTSKSILLNDGSALADDTPSAPNTLNVKYTIPSDKTNDTLVADIAAKLSALPDCTGKFSFQANGKGLSYTEVAPHSIAMKLVPGMTFVHAALSNAITYPGSAVELAAPNADIAPGMVVSGAHIKQGTTVASIDGVNVVLQYAHSENIPAGTVLTFRNVENTQSSASMTYKVTMVSAPSLALRLCYYQNNTGTYGVDGSCTQSQPLDHEHYGDSESFFLGLSGLPNGGTVADYVAMINEFVGHGTMAHLAGTQAYESPNDATVFYVTAGANPFWLKSVDNAEMTVEIVYGQLAYAADSPLNNQAWGLDGVAPTLNVLTDLQNIAETPGNTDSKRADVNARVFELWNYMTKDLLTMAQTGGDLQAVAYDAGIDALTEGSMTVAFDVLDDSTILGGYTNGDESDTLFHPSILDFGSIDPKDANNCKVYELSKVTADATITLLLKTDDASQQALNQIDAADFPQSMAANRTAPFGTAAVSGLSEIVDVGTVGTVAPIAGEALTTTSKSIGNFTVQLESVNPTANTADIVIKATAGAAAFSTANIVLYKASLNGSGINAFRIGNKASGATTRTYLLSPVVLPDPSTTTMSATADLKMAAEFATDTTQTTTIATLTNHTNRFLYFYGSTTQANVSIDGANVNLVRSSSSDRPAHVKLRVTNGVQNRGYSIDKSDFLTMNITSSAYINAPYLHTSVTASASNPYRYVLDKNVDSALDLTGYTQVLVQNTIVLNADLTLGPNTDLVLEGATRPVTKNVLVSLNVPSDPTAIAPGTYFDKEASAVVGASPMEDGVQVTFVVNVSGIISDYAIVKHAGGYTAGDTLTFDFNAVGESIEALKIAIVLRPQDICDVHESDESGGIIEQDGKLICGANCCVRETTDQLCANNSAAAALPQYCYGTFGLALGEKKDLATASYAVQIKETTYYLGARDVAAAFENVFVPMLNSGTQRADSPALTDAMRMTNGIRAPATVNDCVVNDVLLVESNMTVTNLRIETGGLVLNHTNMHDKLTGNSTTPLVPTITVNGTFTIEGTETAVGHVLGVNIVCNGAYSINRAIFERGAHAPAKCDQSILTLTTPGSISNVDILGQANVDPGLSLTANVVASNLSMLRCGIDVDSAGCIINSVDFVGDNAAFGGAECLRMRQYGSIVRNVRANANAHFVNATGASFTMNDGSILLDTPQQGDVIYYYSENASFDAAGRANGTTTGNSALAGNNDYYIHLGTAEALDVDDDMLYNAVDGSPLGRSMRGTMQTKNFTDKHVTVGEYGDQNLLVSERGTWFFTKNATTITATAGGLAVRVNDVSTVAANAAAALAQLGATNATVGLASLDVASALLPQPLAYTFIDANANLSDKNGLCRVVPGSIAVTVDAHITKTIDAPLILSSLWGRLDMGAYEIAKSNTYDVVKYVAFFGSKDGYPNLRYNNTIAIINTLGSGCRNSDDSDYINWQSEVYIEHCSGNAFDRLIKIKGWKGGIFAYVEVVNHGNALFGPTINANPSSSEENNPADDTSDIINGFLYVENSRRPKGNVPQSPVPLTDRLDWVDPTDTNANNNDQLSVTTQIVYPARFEPAINNLNKDAANPRISQWWHPMQRATLLTKYLVSEHASGTRYCVVESNGQIVSKHGSGNVETDGTVASTAAPLAQFKAMENKLDLFTEDGAALELTTLYAGSKPDGVSATGIVAVADKVMTTKTAPQSNFELPSATFTNVTAAWSPTASLTTVTGHEDLTKCLTVIEGRKATFPNREDISRATYEFARKEWIEHAPYPQTTGLYRALPSGAQVDSSFSRSIIVEDQPTLTMKVKDDLENGAIRILRRAQLDASYAAHAILEFQINANESDSVKLGSKVTAVSIVDGENSDVAAKYKITSSNNVFYLQSEENQHVAENIDGHTFVFQIEDNVAGRYDGLNNGPKTIASVMASLLGQRSMVVKSVNDFKTALSRDEPTNGFDNYGIHEVDYSRFFDINADKLYDGIPVELKDQVTADDEERLLAGEATIVQTTTGDLSNGGDAALESFLSNFSFVQDATVTDHVLGTIAQANRCVKLTADVVAGGPDIVWGDSAENKIIVVSGSKTIHRNVLVKPGTQILFDGTGTLTINGSFTIEKGDNQEDSFAIVRGIDDVYLKDCNGEYGGIVVEGEVAIDGLLMIGGAQFQCAGGSIDHARFHGTLKVQNESGTLLVKNSIVQGADTAFANKGALALDTVLVKDCLNAMIDGGEVLCESVILDAPRKSRDGSATVRNLTNVAELAGIATVRSPRNYGAVALVYASADGLASVVNAPIVPAPNSTLLQAKQFLPPSNQTLNCTVEYKEEYDEFIKNINEVADANRFEITSVPKASKTFGIKTIDPYGADTGTDVVSVDRPGARLTTEAIALPDGTTQGTLKYRTIYSRKADGPTDPLNPFTVLSDAAAVVDPVPLSTQYSLKNLGDAYHGSNIVMVRGRWGYSKAALAYQTLGARAIHWTQAYYGKEEAFFNTNVPQEMNVFTANTHKRFVGAAKKDTDGTNLELAEPISFQNELALEIFDAFAYGIEKQSRDGELFGNDVNDLLSVDAQRFLQIDQAMDGNTGIVTLKQKNGPYASPRQTILVALNPDDVKGTAPALKFKADSELSVSSIRLPDGTTTDPSYAMVEPEIASTAIVADLAKSLAVGGDGAVLGTLTTIPALPNTIPTLQLQGDESEIDYYQLEGTAPPGSYNPETVHNGYTLEFAPAQTKRHEADNGLYDIGLELVRSGDNVNVQTKGFSSVLGVTPGVTHRAVGGAASYQIVREATDFNEIFIDVNLDQVAGHVQMLDGLGSVVHGTEGNSNDAALNALLPHAASYTGNHGGLAMVTNITNTLQADFYDPPVLFNLGDAELGAGGKKGTLVIDEIQRDEANQIATVTGKVKNSCCILLALTGDNYTMRIVDGPDGRQAGGTLTNLLDQVILKEGDTIREAHAADSNAGSSIVRKIVVQNHASSQTIQIELETSSDFNNSAIGSKLFRNIASDPIFEHNEDEGSSVQWLAQNNYLSTHAHFPKLNDWILVAQAGNTVDKYGKLMVKSIAGNVLTLGSTADSPDGETMPQLAAGDTLRMYICGNATDGMDASIAEFKSGHVKDGNSNQFRVEHSTATSADKLLVMGLSTKTVRNNKVYAHQAQEYFLYYKQTNEGVPGAVPKIRHRVLSINTGLEYPYAMPRTTTINESNFNELVGAQEAVVSGHTTTPWEHNTIPVQSIDLDTDMKDTTNPGAWKSITRTADLSGILLVKQNEETEHGACFVPREFENLKRPDLNVTSFVGSGGSLITVKMTVGHTLPADCKIVIKGAGFLPAAANSVAPVPGLDGELSGVLAAPTLTITRAAGPNEPRVIFPSDTVPTNLMNDNVNDSWTWPAASNRLANALVQGTPLTKAEAYDPYNDTTNPHFEWTATAEHILPNKIEELINAKLERIPTDANYVMWDHNILIEDRLTYPPGLYSTFYGDNRFYLTYNQNLNAAPTDKPKNNYWAILNYPTNNPTEQAAGTEIEFTIDNCALTEEDVKTYTVELRRANGALLENVATVTRT